MSAYSKETEKQLLDQVSADNLYQITATICEEERLSGSPAEKKSFEYLEATLRSYGLMTSLTYDEAYISIPLQASLEVCGEKYPAVSASMAASTPASGVDLEMLFIGDPDDFDLYADQVAGKALIVYGFVNRPLAQKAARANARACIFINGERLHTMIVSPVWGNPLPETFHLMPDIYVVAIDNHAGAKVIAHAKSGCKAHIETTVLSEWRKIPTLIAEKKGTMEPGKFVLVSGHVDSWFLGAMDNAGANAGTVEIGRLLAHVPLRRSLRLAFWSGHSHGRYAGSTLYMDHNFQDIHDNCLIHINVDSIGAKGATVITEGNTMPLTKRLSREVLKEYAGIEFKGKPFGRGGDHSFFGAGVPASFMGFSMQPLIAAQDDMDTQYMIKQFHGGPDGCGFGWWWHSPEDTMDKIDGEVLKRDTQLYLAHVYRYCTYDILPYDLSAGLEELHGYLAAYKQKAAADICLHEVEKALQSLSGVANEAAAKTIQPASEEEKCSINNALRIIAGIIVRMGYCGPLECDHDLALDVSRWPLLSDINKLAMVKDQHQRLMLINKIRRMANQSALIINTGVKEARSALF